MKLGHFPTSEAPKFSKKIFLFSLKRTASVNGSSLFAASKSARRDRAAHDVIVAAVANLYFLDSCSSHLMLTNRKANYL
ncbi:hypothetical protein Y032_0002g827 [Ancylostoma ceylanicum]|uniref:Uncharacterized protein n=1 Tax=Ancylostoma ceylanicum TaxID=53326 RepID=A0A016W0Y3_9BILA|nr:hypothetical protein Y032_0002g827 [Ancylostoma ceylanicum]